MSERINSRDNRATIRWKLLTSASALALTAAVTSANMARAEDSDQPLIWIELGGQMENITGQGEVFAPPFLAANPNSSVLWNGVTPLQAQKPPAFSFGEDGKISFQPEGSDWIFSAAIRYGRSSSARHIQHQTNGIHYTNYYRYQTAGGGHTGHPAGLLLTTANFADTHVEHRENHAVLDFSAGKDVGLGLFGKETSTVLSLGVRFAQFVSKSAFDIRARPDLHEKYYSFQPSSHSTHRLDIPYFNTNHATGQASRSFRGVGPSLSWTGSTPFVGNVQDGELTFDWGANAAILFGKQRAHVQHMESEHYHNRVFVKYYQSVYPPHSGGHDTDRSVTVPNVGGSLGLSWRVRDFKVSMGYRADFFLGAFDGGIDTRKSETLAFKGPFASISVGLGD